MVRRNALGCAARVPGNRLPGLYCCSCVPALAEHADRINSRETRELGPSTSGIRDVRPRWHRLLELVASVALAWLAMVPATGALAQGSHN